MVLVNTCSWASTAPSSSADAGPVTVITDAAVGRADIA
jgi:hypothetical protein